MVSGCNQIVTSYVTDLARDIPSDELGCSAAKGAISGRLSRIAMPTRPALVRFGLFELDLAEGVLIKNGRRIKLQEQPFRLLSILLEHPGETVTREQLAQGLWPADTFVDFDRSLNAAVAKLRQALGDSADNPRFIETQARRGYRFIAPVTGPVEAVVVAATDASKSRFTRRSVTRGLTGALLLLLIGAGILYYRDRRDQHGNLAELLPHPVPLTTYPGFQWMPTFSPEGSRVAFAWEEPGKRPSNIYVKLIGSGEPVRLTTGETADFAPAWSPDGRYIAFLRARGSFTTAVMLIPSLGGPERELTRLHLDGTQFFEHGNWVPTAPLLAWSSDNKYLLALEEDPSGATSRLAGQYGILRISVESGQQAQLKLLGDWWSGNAHRNLHSGDAGLALSPDGRTLAFAHTLDFLNNHLFAARLSPDMLPIGPPRSLHFDSGYVSGIAWDAHGQDLLVSADRLWKVPLNPRREPAALNLGDAAPRELAVSKNGQRLVFAHYSFDADIWRADLRSAHLKDAAQLIASTRLEIRPAYSSNGTRIAFESNRTGNEEIWTSNADGSQPLQLTSFGNSYAGSPRWSPDDRQIAFDSNAAGKWDIYVISSEGGKPVRFTQASGSNSRPSWSHDGKWIYYCALESSGAQIWKKPAAGGAEIQLTNKGGCNQMESADGAYVYYLKSRDSALWRVPTGGGQESQVLALTHRLQFALGTRGAYLIEKVAPTTLKYLDFVTGATKVLGVLPGPVFQDRGLAVSSDEHWLLYGKDEYAGSQLMLVEGFR
jgi:Tol biopolymer transport system component/DNA-binding winged helix-turn-helix (wHTH) protein